MSKVLSHEVVKAGLGDERDDDKIAACFLDVFHLIMPSRRYA